MTQLIDIAQRLETGQALSGAERAAAAAALRKQIGAEPLHLRRGRRDRIFRDIAATHCAGMSINEQAIAIGRAANRYKSIAWLREQGEGETHEIRNPRPRGTIEHDIWNALTAYPVVPAKRQMSTILAA